MREITNLIEAQFAIEVTTIRFYWWHEYSMEISVCIHPSSEIKLHKWDKYNLALQACKSITTAG